jgi:hypothetical protein
MLLYDMLSFALTFDPSARGERPLPQFFARRLPFPLLEFTRTTIYGYTSARARDVKLRKLNITPSLGNAALVVI